MATSIITKHKNAYQVGDTIDCSTMERMIYNGNCTSNSQEIDFTVPLDMPISDDVTTITIEYLNGLFRGTQGYVDGITSSTNLLTRYTCTAQKGFCGVKFRVVSSDAMTNLTGNTPVSCLARFRIIFA